MTNNPELETKIIRRFIIKAKQDRYIGFIGDIRNRGKFISYLTHFSKNLNQELFDEIKGDERQVIADQVKKARKTEWLLHKFRQQGHRLEKARLTRGEIH